MNKALIVVTVFSIVFSSVTIEGMNTPARHTVLVVLDAKSGSKDVLKKELLKVKELSEKESTCLEYRVYEDTQKPNRVILYENWTSKADHAKQFEKPYIIEFGKKLDGLLEKPYEATFAKELN